MTTPAPIAEPTPPADPHQGWPAAHARTLRVLGLVRALIIFGKTLAVTVRRSSTGETGYSIGSRFGTRSVARILARISRGLRLAASLETTLADRAAQWDAYWNAGPSPAPASAPRRPRSRSTPWPALPQDSTESPLANLPTSHELARQFRRRPVHAVLADIAFDLGLDRSDPLWREVEKIIFELRGGFATVIENLRSRRASFLHSILPNVRLARPERPQLSESLIVPLETKPATGPPWPSAQFRKA